MTGNLSAVTWAGATRQQLRPGQVAGSVHPCLFGAIGLKEAAQVLFRPDTLVG